MLPKNKNPHIGVEIEFYSLVYKEQVEKILEKHLLSFIDWDLGRDGSIEPPERPCKECMLYTMNFNPNDHTHYESYELRLLMEESKIKQCMEELQVAFKHIQPKVNSSCGLHVHLDARFKNKELMFENLVNCQELFYKMNPTGRRDGDYSRPNLSKKFSEAESTEGRYKAINASAFRKFKTIEVRVHQGCVTPSKIRAWLMILTKISNRKHKYKSEINSLLKFKRVHKLEKEVESYIKKNVKLYSKVG